MLEFETILRAEGESLPIRALAMLAVSNKHRCEYGIARSKFDLQRSGKAADWISSLDGKRLDLLSSLEKKIYLFAETLSTAPKEVTQEQVESLAKEVGEDELVAIVLAIGYANMMDRLALALQLPTDSTEAIQRVSWKFSSTDPTGADTIAAERPGIPQKLRSCGISRPDDSLAGIGVRCIDYRTR